MRIRELRASQPATPGSPPDWRTQLGLIAVEVHTDEGLSGLGIGAGGLAGIHVVKTVLSDLLVGRDAADVESLHRLMCRHTLFYGRKGIAVMALSGVDLALWDLRGKAAGLPVAKLLNPSVDLSRPLPTYTTVFDVNEVDAAAAAGHAAVKLHADRFGEQPDVPAIVRTLAEMRKRLGPKRQLMLDAFTRWDVATTLRVLDEIARFDIAWLEEPLAPDDLAGYEELSRRAHVPIAGGEHEYLMEGFRPLVERRLHSVLQPDIYWCGGLTTLIEIYKLAGEAGLKVCPHRGSEPFALAAIAALDPTPLAESPRRWFKALAHAPVIEQGVVRPSDGPGFGVDLVGSQQPK